MLVIIHVYINLEKACFESHLWPLIRLHCSEACVRTLGPDRKHYYVRIRKGMTGDLALEAKTLKALNDLTTLAITTFLTTLAQKGNLSIH